MYAKATDLNTFVREFLGVPDDGSSVPTTLQLMEVSASLENYLPLSGGETTGTVMVPQLSASSSVVVGDPNIGSLGPNETGQHLSGVVITDGGVLDLQGKWITDNTWHKVVIDPLGQITQFRFEGLPL